MIVAQGIVFTIFTIPFIDSFLTLVFNIESPVAVYFVCESIGIDALLRADKTRVPIRFYRWLFITLRRFVAHAKKIEISKAPSRFRGIGKKAKPAAHKVWNGVSHLQG